MTKIHLQGISGAIPAKKVKDFKVGENMVCNFGEKQQIISKQPTKSNKSYYLTVKCSNGKLYTRRYSADTLYGAEKK